MPAPTSTTSVFGLGCVGQTPGSIGPSWSRGPLDTAYRCSGYPAAFGLTVPTTVHATPDAGTPALRWLSCLDGSPTCCPATGSSTIRPRARSRRRGRARRRPLVPPRRARRAGRAARCSMVHGFTDYFFNTELADHFAARGFAFYALDLHKCGRSRQQGQTPHFTTDLAPLRRRTGAGARRSSRRDRRRRVLVAAHSAGGLIVPLWLDRLRRRGGDRARGRHRADPQQPVARPAGPAVPAHRRHRRRRSWRWRGCASGRWSVAPTEGGYGTTLHRDYAGDFDYNLDWKPIGGFPVTFGWIHAIRRGHAQAAPRPRRRGART